MGANPSANGGRLVRDLDLPPFRDYAIEVKQPGVDQTESVRRLGQMTRDIFARNVNAANFRLFCPDETNSNRMSAVFDVENRCSCGLGSALTIGSLQMAESWRC
jgi:xylulose-5-phosphate/fructose-6-phosphate phosphoketolase